jgi:hypothetical protein
MGIIQNFSISGYDNERMKTSCCHDEPIRRIRMEKVEKRNCPENSTGV